VSALLLARYGGRWPLAYWKPVATGARLGRDVETVELLAGRRALVLPETFLYREPLSPHSAARLEGREVLVPALLSDFARHARPERGLLVEGVGGLLVPFDDRGYLLADLLVAMGLPCLVVAHSGLGTLNHTLLTLEALRARRLLPAAVVLNGPRHPENRRTLEALAGVEAVLEVEPLPILNAAAVERAAAGLDPEGRLERWLRPAAAAAE
nr:dethiobiotin synthase [Acidobacteriota bacterium]